MTDEGKLTVYGLSKKETAGIAALAKKNERSVSAEIRLAIRAWLAK